MARALSSKERVKVNVGGTVFETSFSTLKKYGDSQILPSLCGRYDGQGEIFIDRNPASFAKVLDYLRDGDYVVLPEDVYSLKCLRREAEFYNLPGLAEICSAELQLAVDRHNPESERAKRRFRHRRGHRVEQIRKRSAEANCGTEHKEDLPEEEKDDKLHSHSQPSKVSGDGGSSEKPFAIFIGSQVTWAEFAMETCWLTHHRRRDHVEGYKCMACGFHVFGGIVATPDMMNGCKEDSEPHSKPRVMNGKKWVPLNTINTPSTTWGYGGTVAPADPIERGVVIEVNSTCCRVKWTFLGDTHVPQSALRSRSALPLVLGRRSPFPYDTDEFPINPFMRVIFETDSD